MGLAQLIAHKFEQSIDLGDLSAKKFLWCHQMTLTFFESPNNGKVSSRGQEQPHKAWCRP